MLFGIPNILIDTRTKPVSIKVFMILFESNFSDPYVVEKLPDQRLSIGKKP